MKTLWYSSHTATSFYHPLRTPASHRLEAKINHPETAMACGDTARRQSAGDTSGSPSGRRATMATNER